MPLLHYQPLKFLYLLYFVLKTAFIKVPFWTLISLHPSTRPKASWSIKKCLRIYLLRSVVTLPIKLGLVLKRDLTKGVSDSTLQNAKFVWVDGIEAGALVGDIRKYAETAGVKPVRVPGYWQLKKGYTGEWTPKAKDGERVIYHLHGGAFWMGTAHPSDATARIPRGILKHSQTVTRTFAVDYRLSASAPFRAENPFPAGLIDCISGYQYLIKQGFRPENIVLAGDSAGGNLSMGLMRYLLEDSSGLEKPGKMLLFSPWGDLSSSRDGPDSSILKNWKTDMFPAVPPSNGTFGGYGARSYIGAMAHEEMKTNKYISPTSPHLGKGKGGDFEGYPQTYIVVGGAELLLDDGEVIAEGINRDSGGREEWAKLDVTADAVHDFCVFPWFEPERGRALVRVSKWIDA